MLLLAVLLSVLGLAVGPLLFAWGRGRALPAAALEGLSLGLIPAVVLLAEIMIAGLSWKAGPGLSGRHIVQGSQPNIVALGQLLYSRYLFAFELAGLILLVAMIGAIVLTHRSRRDTRPQNVAKQNARRPEDATRMTQPGVGEGMKL